MMVLSDKPSAILQMPRGNLEALYPRSLVLPHVMGLISKGEYGSAVEVMRRQKVDLNLLVDMNPDRFLLPTGDGGVGKGGGKGDYYYDRVIDQVREIDRINLFLSNLKDCDVTEWKYKVPFWIDRNCRSMSEEEKKNDEEGEEKGEEEEGEGETMTTEEEEYGE